MELTLNKQKILQEFTPKSVILFNNELLESLFNDFTNNELIGYSGEDKRRCNYTRDFEIQIDRGGVNHNVFIEYQFDFTKHRNDDINWVTVNINDITCYIAEGKHEDDEVEILYPFWDNQDKEELEQSIIKYYNS